ncbi:MAG: endonuclease [Flavobacteriales bacterium]|jgi:endonuclease I
MLRGLAFAFVLLGTAAQAQPPAGYYGPAQGLSGPALRQALYEIINDHTVITYSMLWEAFYETDRKPDGTVWDMYSDVPGGAPPYSFQFVSDQCGTYNGEGDCFNREHSFPQSWFDGALPMNTELFHLYPTDAWVNQKRSNWPYGQVTAPTWTSNNGSKLGPCSYPGCSGTVFEPIDAYKGDLARSYFYMLTRYLPNLTSWNCPMMANGEFLPWAEAMLIDWHLQDPVSPKEVARNNAVYGIQDNRNPFIDNPQWVQAIWGPTASVSEGSATTTKLWWAADVLYLRMDALGTTSIVVRDVAGRTIQQITLGQEATEVSLPLDQGAYLITVERGAARSTLRVVR